MKQIIINWSDENSNFAVVSMVDTDDKEEASKALKDAIANRLVELELKNSLEDAKDCVKNAFVAGTLYNDAGEYCIQQLNDTTVSVRYDSFEELFGIIDVPEN